ncbi:hypothetical protein FM120_18235 [Sphingobacterium faecium PCAi_F2.5]|nr:hypothetical protein FM120_18235 [Sphingobacterium faecium PCAi_F2.5]
MKIETHKIKEIEVAETLSDKIVIALGLMDNVYYQDFEKMISTKKILH